MTSPELLALRLENQKLSSHNLSDPREIVAWMGAMQAQDFLMANLAIGIRTSNSDKEDVLEAFNKGEILRTHLMRPTWHFVSSEDIYWMLDLTAPQIKSVLKTRHRNLELTERVVKQALEIIENAFLEEPFISKESLSSALSSRNIRTDENRMAHILLTAETEGLICSGPVRGNKVSYSLLSERVPGKKELTREESLAELAKRYFRGHSPATLRDFAWWSGLSLKDARIGLESLKNELEHKEINSVTYWFWNKMTESKSKSSFHLLPAYDEFLIGYQDRSAALIGVQQKKIISENGIFRPVVLVNGVAQGLWKKVTKKDLITIEVSFFQKPDKNMESLCREKINQFIKYYNQDIFLNIV